MPIHIAGQPWERVPKSVKKVYDSNPILKESANHFDSLSCQEVPSTGSLYVMQREYAIVSKEDDVISILGSDDATTCSVLILRNSRTGSCAAGHFDGSDVAGGVSGMISGLSSSQEDDIDIYIIGGFDDDRDMSEDLCLEILNALHQHPRKLNLKILFVCRFNTNVRNGDVKGPKFLGAAINVKTGDVFPALFPAKGPNMPLRHARIYGDAGGMVNVYDTNRHLVKITPFSYEPFETMDLYLKAPDELVLQLLSTSPLVEPPHFVSQIKSTFEFIKKNPVNLVFKDGLPVCYKHNLINDSWNLVEDYQLPQE